MKKGNNHSGTQRYLYKCYRKSYTAQPKQRTYNEEIRPPAFKPLLMLCHLLKPIAQMLRVFADAYSRFSVAKIRFRQGRDPRAREVPFSVLDFL